MTATDAANKLDSWKYSLKAERKSQHTIRQYLESAGRFLAWYDRPATDATREDLRAHLARLLDNHAPATVRFHYAGLRAYYAWLVAEGELASSPMDGIRPPRVPETQKDVVPQETMASVLKELDRSPNKRDAAIISLLYDTGLRASELCRLRLSDINWEDGCAVIRQTKNGETRTVGLSAVTIRRLDRWVRQRKDRAQALFIAQQGRGKGQALSRSGLFQLVRRVFNEAGIEGIGPHDLRHTFATHFLEDESARVEDLMTLAGWKSPAMAARYTKQRKEARALAAHRRLSPVGRLT